MAIPLNQQRPRYREAHPRFDIVQARARAADRPVLVFEERGGTRGQLIIPADGMSDDHIRIAYTIAAPGLRIATEETELQLRPAPNGIGWDRFAVVCPDCQSSVFSLYYVQTWKCARCNRLSYRSQLISPLLKLNERQELIRSQLADGRPVGMHVARFEELRAELVKLNRKVGRRHRVASDRNSAIMTSTWTALADLRDGLWPDHYYIVGDHIEHQLITSTDL